MRSILIIIGLYFFINGIYQLIKYIIIFSEIKKYQSINIYLKSLIINKIFILAPVLHEEKTLEYFLNNLSLQNYPKDYYEVYIITTDKEYLDNKNNFNTIDILNKLKTENKIFNSNFIHLHYPNNQGFKSEQLNFAFDYICKNIGEKEVSNAFFLLFDADSDIEANTLKNFNNSFSDQFEIYQQPRLWFKNIDLLKDPLMQSFSFMQSFFSLSYEAPMFIDRFFPWRLKYFIGSGLCLKGSFLLRVGGFPKIIEDVRLGRIASFLNVKVKLIPYLGKTEVAKNFFIYIKQSSVWFFGCGLFLSDFLYKIKLNNNHKNKFKDIILILYGYFKMFRWLNKGLIHFLGILFSIVYNDYIIFIIYFVSLIINSVIPVLLVSNDFKNIWNKNIKKKYKILRILLTSVIFSPIIYVFNFFGLYYGLFKLINFYLWKKVKLQKTER